MPKLFHVSDHDDIGRFVPRAAPTNPSTSVAVWAIDEAHLGHYLLPRDCPRVCFRAGPTTTASDRHGLLLDDPTARVIAIEAMWWERIRTASMPVYEMPDRSFELLDATAGYDLSESAVVPEGRRQIDDLPAAILDLGYELRIVPNSWPLRDAVVESTRDFSIIRWRNATARPGASRGPTPGR